jgi:hypothetical protein
VEGRARANYGEVEVVFVAFVESIGRVVALVVTQFLIKLLCGYIAFVGCVVRTSSGDVGGGQIIFSFLNNGDLRFIFTIFCFGIIKKSVRQLDDCAMPICVSVASLSPISSRPREQW